MTAQKIPPPPDDPPHRHRGKFTENLLNPELILAVLDIRPGYIVLDAGCGSGYMARIFSGQVGSGGRVFALDTDPMALEILGRQIGGTCIEILQGDICSVTPIPSATLDLLFISAVIHGFSKSQMAGFLCEARRLLKPGAALAIVEIEKRETPFGPPLAIRFSPEELVAVIPMEPAGTLAVGEHFYMQLFTNRERRR